MRDVLRKGASIAAVTLFATAAMAGCSSDSSSTTSGATSGDSAAAGDDISAEITYAFWDENQRPAIEQNIADFNEKYPNIKVSVNVTPWDQYWTKLQTQAESNTLPDVFWMNGPNIALYGSNGLLAPVDPMVDKGLVDTANYPTALNDLYTIEGVQYGIPKDFDTVGVFYNKAMFEEAGVELPQPGWTWDDFNKTAADLQAALGDQGIYAVASPLDGQSAYYNTILQAGGTLFGPDSTATEFASPEAIAGFQFWADLVEAGEHPTPKQLIDADSQTMFGSGKAAMCWTGTWSVSRFLETDIVDDIDVVELPVGKTQGVVIHGLANVINATSPNMEAAELFSAYLGSEEAQTTQAEMGAANPAFNGTQQAFVDSVPNWNLQIFEDAAEYAHPYPITMNTQAIMDLQATLVPTAYTGEATVEEMATQLAAQADELLNK